LQFLGTGVAGMASAITAAEGGAKTVILGKILFLEERPTLRSYLFLYKK
jgi:thioredoxin reductase